MPIQYKLPLEDRFVARALAQVVVRNGFDARAVIAELHPERKGFNALYARLMDDELLQSEMGKVMSNSRTGRDSKAFINLMWKWLENEGEEIELGPEKKKVKVLGKEGQEQKVTAARILAKGYISEKKESAQDAKPFKIGGLGDDAVKALTGDDTDGKVM